MWVFGHLGIGSKIARPLSRGLPLRWLLLGTVTPDLIDKPLFALATWAGSSPGLISCTRTFGHTGLLVLLIAGSSRIWRSKPLAALSLGIATHLLLDGLQEAVGRHLFGVTGDSSLLMALLFPFYKSHFAPYPFQSAGAHLATVFNPITLVAEMLGVLILYRDFLREHWAKFRFKS